MNAGDGRFLYPMLGVGAFFTLFWTGFVAAYSVGAPCLLMILCGVASGWSGCAVVVTLEFDARRGAPRRRLTSPAAAASVPPGCTVAFGSPAGRR